MKLYKTLTSAMKDRDEVRALKLKIDDGKFPHDIFFLSNLEELYLEGNCQKLPDIKSTWPKLKIMSVNWSEFQGDLAALFSLPLLENLKIIETPQKRLILPLGRIAAPLKSLTLKNLGLENLPQEISMVTTLEELNISGNQLTKLPEAFPELKKLKRLNLDKNQFSTFPDLIKSMPALSHLSIDNNPFSDDEKDRIQRVFHIWL